PAVVAAAQAGARALRKLSSYFKAPREIEELISEIQTILASVKDIESFLELGPDVSYRGSMLEFAQRANSTIVKINDLLASKTFKVLGLNEANQAWAV
ncbi:hypothetical protein MMC28_003695, partial [Mycoblastus sanguinarius]|nr:hypothetical protein [Mycoblastus sanguinarius]